MPLAPGPERVEDGDQLLTGRCQPVLEPRRAVLVLPASSIRNVEGDGNYVRVQVLTNAGALDRDRQVAAVRALTDVVARAAGDPSLAERTWVLLTEAPDGGWGLAGTAYTNDGLVQLARAEIAAAAGS